MSRFCQDCKHYNWAYRCTRSAYGDVSLVTGYPQLDLDKLLRADRERSGGSWLDRLRGIKRCGPEGAFWERRPTIGLPPNLKRMQPSSANE